MSNPEQKFLVIGATGLIGQSIIHQLQDRHPYTGTSYKSRAEGLLMLDITDAQSAQKTIKKVSPRCVILCANLSGGVQFCQDHPDLARKWHYEGTVHVGRACRKIRAKLIYISSECVFSGKKELYKEEDTVDPISVYGQMKAESESWIQKNLKRYVIARTMSVFGWQPKTRAPNAVMSTYFKIANKEKVIVPQFRFCTPTYVDDLAQALIELSLWPGNGLFHVVGPTYLSRYAWLKRVCRKLGWDESLVVPQKNPPRETGLYPSKIRLSSRKFHSQFKTQLHALDRSLERLKRAFEADQRPNNSNL